jgi:hypothetical protein
MMVRTLVVSMLLAAGCATTPRPPVGAAAAPDAPAPSTAAASPTAAAPPAAAPRAIPLSFADIFDADAPTLAPSAKLRALDGKRVRLVGFMASMEDPPPGGFWLTSRPVHCDESGGGTADLPPDAVFVVLRSAAATGATVAHRPGALAATGILRLEPSAIQLLLDGPPAAAPSRATP